MNSIRAVLLAALFLCPAALGEEEADTETVVKEFKAAMKAKDAADRLAAIEAAGRTRHEDVAAALAKHLSDRDPKVRAAIARALGRQGVTKHARDLLARVGKWERDDAEAVLAYLEGLALLPDRASIRVLADIVRKILSGPRLEDRAVGIAAVKALGAIREAPAAEELTRLLDLTRPLGAAAGYVSDEVRVFRTSHRQAAFEALTEITGEHIRVTDVWQAWWRKAGKRFQPPEKAPDPDAEPVFRASGYGFVLEKPAETWKFARNDWENLVIKLEHRRDAESRGTDAELYVEAYSISEYSVQTPEQACADMDAWARTTGFKKDENGRASIREGPTSTEVEVAGQEAMLWRVAGTAASGKEVVLRKYFFLRDSLLYTVTLESAAGLPDSIGKDLDRAFASFRFVD